jgi:hypothetical protein
MVPETDALNWAVWVGYTLTLVGFAVTDAGTPAETKGVKTAATNALAVGLGLAGSVQEYEMVSEPALSPDI